MSKTVAWAIQKAFLHSNRKATPPNVGTTKYTALLNIADSMQQLWAEEEGIEWNDLYSLMAIGTISSTSSFPLASTIDYISKDANNPIRLVSPDLTTYVDYKLVKPGQLHENLNNKVCAQIGRNLVFPKSFKDTDTVQGYTIKVPAIVYPNDIAAATDTVQVPRPMWLAYMMAAEFVRNDVVKQGQYDNLLALADTVMTKMKDENGGTIEELTTAGWQAAGQEWA